MVFYDLIVEDGDVGGRGGGGGGGGMFRGAGGGGGRFPRPSYYRDFIFFPL